MVMMMMTLGGAVCQRATKLITLATETSLLTIQPRPNIHTPHRLLTSEEDACIFLVFSFNLVPQRDQVPITSTLSLNCISKAVTFHRRNRQREGHEICGACRCARLRISLPQQGRGCPLRRGSALRHLSSRAGSRHLPGQGAAPSRDNCLFLSSLDSILAATTLLLGISLRRSIISAERTANLATASPLTSHVPHSASFAFSVWAIALVVRPFPRALLPALLLS